MELPEIDKSNMIGGNGAALTQSLIYESMITRPEGRYVFTLGFQDIEIEGKTVYSLKKIYMELADPTEYAVAEHCFLHWDQWQRIRNNKMFKGTIDKWAEELEVKLMSESLKSLRSSAINDGSKGMAAAKYLANKGWQPTRGRPSKDEVERQTRIDAGLQAELKDDLERIGFTH